jgi:aspartyl protease family protein
MSDRRGWWIGLIIALAVVGAFALSQLYPGSLSGKDGQQSLLQWVMLLAIVGSGLVRLRLRPHEALRNILLWVAIAAVLALGYSFRDDITSLWTRVRADFAPGYPVQTGPHEMVVSQSEDGSFYVVGQVNGQAVRFLADTGSSDIVLSPRDAQRLGVDLSSLKFAIPSETANGVGRGASYTASSLQVGSVRIEDVPMQINQAPMSASLLGMTFFKRLDSFQVKDGKLYMRWTG